MSLAARRLPALAALWIGLGLFGCGPDVVGETGGIAEVDGQILQMNTLRRAVDSRLEDEPDGHREAIAREELDRMIEEQLMLNRAHALGLEISEAEVSERIRLVHGDDFELSDDREYREKVRRQMLTDRAALRDLVGQLQVPEAALASYFEQNRKRYAQPQRIRIRQIVVEDADKARDLHERLRKGADFATLARENSLAPEAAQGGLLPPFARGELPEVFDQAFDLSVGQISDVIESPHGFHIFSLVEVLPASEPEFAEVRELLQGELAQERLEKLRLGWLHDLRQSAEVKVNEQLLETL